MQDSKRVGRASAIAVSALLSWATQGCAGRTTGDAEPQAVPSGRSPGAGVVASPSWTNSGPSIGAGQVTVGEPTRDAYCAGKGPPVGVTQPQANASGPSCTTGIAGQVFEHGLCACRDAIFTGAFSIDSFDSTHAASKTNASVGTNGEFAATGLVDIHGSLIVAGSRAVPITTGGYNVDGNFETNSDLFMTGANIRFGRDLWVNGAISTLGSASVAGDVYQTPGNSLLGMSIGGKLHQQDFQIQDPCPCAEAQLLDIESIVAAGTASNHNSAAGLKSGSVFSIGAGGALNLGCGRFAFNDVNVVGAGAIKTEGRTALFIDGDLTITGSFDVDVGSTGELDVFITRNLLITGASSIGSRDRPAALRFYVGGSGDIAITGATRFAANLYAPRSNVFVTGADEIYGAFLVGSYAATGAQVMHYDSAILNTAPGNTCPPPTEHCAQDLDCRSPLVCGAGACKNLSPE